METNIGAGYEYNANSISNFLHIHKQTAINMENACQGTLTCSSLVSLDSL